MTEYLPGQRNLSVNTIHSYRDTFVQLIAFCRDEKNIQPEKLRISLLTRKVIEEYLSYLEDTRRCGISTRNQRLAAIKAFMRFIQVEEPEHLLLCQNVLSISNKGTIKPVVKYLNGDEIRYLLESPGMASPKSRRDTAILSLLYDSAARVQELCDIKVEDLRLEKPSVLKLHGKGRKEREIPLSAKCVSILEKYIYEHKLNRPALLCNYLFFNNRNEKLTRNGVSYILKKYMNKLYEDGYLKNKKNITPHCLRHSKAMHLVNSGVNLIYIRDFLGHESVETTQIYAKANPESVRNAIAIVSDKIPISDSKDWRSDPDIMNMLRNI